MVINWGHNIAQVNGIILVIDWNLNNLIYGLGVILDPSIESTTTKRTFASMTTNRALEITSVKRTVNLK